MPTKEQTPKLVRMTALVREDTDAALRELARKRSEGKVSREIRRALDEYVERETEAAA